jgi:oligopeptide transport system permease protein
MMRVVDVISTVPLTLYVILIMVILPRDSGITSIIIALGSVYWVNMARVVRGEVLTLKEQDYVHGAKIMGSSTWHILTRHLIPNAMGPIIVTVTMLIPQAIFIEAFMSFIGLGVSPPMASWGTMSNDALEALRTNPYQLFAPSLAICLTMFGFNFIGDGLRDVLDPKLRGR